MPLPENDWTLLIHPKAEKELAELEAKNRRLVDRAILELATDPLAGDVQWLQPHGLNQYRKRVGRWRIFYDIIKTDRKILITAIKPRTSTTY